MAKVEILLLTKTAKKTYLLGPHIPVKYKGVREYPDPGGDSPPPPA